MNNVKLTKTETETLKDFEAGKFKQLKNVEKSKLHYQKSARHTMSKSMTINIRISEKDLQKIKAMAIEKGMPYQTFITSILHQQSSGKLK